MKMKISKGKKKKKKKKGKTEEVAKVKTDSVANRKKDALQPYARVITGKAKTMNGFFKVHNVEGRYYFEIPDSLFGRDVLIVNREGSRRYAKAQSRLSGRSDRR